MFCLQVFCLRCRKFLWPVSHRYFIMANNSSYLIVVWVRVDLKRLIKPRVLKHGIFCKNLLDDFESCICLFRPLRRAFFLFLVKSIIAAWWCTRCFHRSRWKLIIPVKCFTYLTVLGCHMFRMMWTFDVWGLIPDWLIT